MFVIRHLARKPAKQFIMWNSIKQVSTAVDNNLGKQINKTETISEKPLSFWHSEHLLSNEKLNEFMQTLPEVIQDTQVSPKHPYASQLNLSINEMFSYFLPYGKKFRAHLMIAAYEMLEKPENLTAENMKLANYMGWVLEMFQGFLLIMDDLVDQSEVRRGVPSWHMRENVGMRAVTDGIYLEHVGYFLLRKYFSNHRYYLPMVNLFQDVIRKTILGQLLDGFSTQNGKPRFDLFTMERFNTIALYKTGFDTFDRPITTALYMSNQNDSEVFKKLSNIYKNLGELYQMKNDYMDSFSSLYVPKESSDDIKEGKCSWLIVTALQKANASQRKMLEKCYGSQNPEDHLEVLNLYKDLKLPELYVEAVQNYVNDIKRDIKKISNNKPLQGLLHKVIKSLEDIV